MNRKSVLWSDNQPSTTPVGDDENITGEILEKSNETKREFFESAEQSNQPNPPPSDSPKPKGPTPSDPAEPETD